VPIEEAPVAPVKEVLDGVAVLHWTWKDGFTLGFGHGIAPPKSAKQQAGLYYYTHVTGAGASGAPVFDADTGNLVCLHQMGNIKDRWASCTSLAKIVEAISAQEGAKRFALDGADR
jgi:hypothetical protein